MLCYCSEHAGHIRVAYWHATTDADANEPRLIMVDIACEAGARELLRGAASLAARVAQCMAPTDQPVPVKYVCQGQE
jgi:hypothetical protein